MHYIDFHCDTLLMFGKPETSPDALYQNDLSVDFLRMKKADCGAQFFATFMPQPEWMNGMSDEEFRQKLYAGLMGAITRHPDMIAFAKNYQDYEKNREKGLMSAFLTFEDGRMIDWKFDNLQKYYTLGYRLITLTWNFANCFGYPNSQDPEVMEKGLTSFGKEAVQQMNQLGIIVDVSHLSDGGFWDVVEISRKPFIASHSCCRSLTPHTRNLTDPMIRAIAEKGGIVGINFAPEFVGYGIHDRLSSVKRICDHIQHMVKVGGMDIIALGSDFDGISGELEVASPPDFAKLYSELLRRGFSDNDIEKISHANAERILREVL
ncbi:MAG: dipeptidase [Firmicutes bacterium]|nr:dipeptidase [Bacillota bacterium]